MFDDVHAFVCVLPWVWGREIDTTQISCSHSLSIPIIIKKSLPDMAKDFSPVCAWWKVRNAHTTLGAAKEVAGVVGVLRHESWCFEMRTNCVTFRCLPVPQLVVHSKGVWWSCVFMFDLFIWFPLMRCHSCAFTLYFYLIPWWWKWGKCVWSGVCGQCYFFFTFSFFIFAARLLWSSFSYRPSVILGDLLGRAGATLRPHAATAGLQIETSFHSHQVFVEVCGYACFEQTLKWFHSLKQRPVPNCGNMLPFTVPSLSHRFI